MHDIIALVQLGLAGVMACPQISRQVGLKSCWLHAGNALNMPESPAHRLGLPGTRQTQKVTEHELHAENEGNKPMH